MGLAELRLQLHEVIDRVTDSNKLEAIFTLLNGSLVDKPSEEQELIRRSLEAEEDIKNGDVFTIEEVEARLNRRFGK